MVRRGERVMTMPSTAQKIGDRLPSADERASANQLRKILASHLSEGGNQILTALDSKGQKAACDSRGGVANGA